MVWFSNRTIWLDKEIIQRLSETSIKKVALTIFYGAHFAVWSVLYLLTHWRKYSFPTRYKRLYFSFLKHSMLSVCIYLHICTNHPTFGYPKSLIILERNLEWKVISNMQSQHISGICKTRNILLLIAFYSSYLLTFKITPICFARWKRDPIEMVMSTSSSSNSRFFPLVSVFGVCLVFNKSHTEGLAPYKMTGLWHSHFCHVSLKITSHGAPKAITALHARVHHTQLTNTKGRDWSQPTPGTTRRSHVLLMKQHDVLL